MWWNSRTWRVVVAVLASVALSAPAAAATGEFRVLVDVDNDATTGCTVATADGAVTGVDQMLVTTVNLDTATVSAVAAQQCSGGSFGAPVPVTSPAAPPWPLDLGSGAVPTVVETGFELPPPAAGTARLAFASSLDTGGGDALLTTTGAAGGGPILVDLGEAAGIPTAGTWGLLLLAALLAGVGILLLRRRSSQVATCLGVILLAGALGAAWAALLPTPDGDRSDWAGIPPLATDPSGDAPSQVDILAAYAVGARIGTGAVLVFRLDLVPNAPPVAQADTVSTDEDTPLVITLNGSDPDGDPLTFSITAGPTSGALGALTTLTPTSAQVTYTPDPDFNGADSFTFQVDDGVAGTDTAVVSITVSPVNDPPVVNSQTFTVPENSPNGTTVGTVAASDPDTGETLNFAITAGNTGGAFAINPTTGEITVADSTQLDYETTPSFALTVQVTDDGTPPLSGSGTVTVNLTNVNDPPVVTPATFTVAENSPNGTTVGTVAASDSDTGETLTFAITAGNTGGAFAINSATGEITVANSSALDYETTPSFSLTVQATDDGTPPLSGSGTVTVDLTNVNEPPTVTAATFSVPENSPNGTSVGTVSFSDPDAGQTVTLAITGGNAGGAFNINSSTGEITVANSSALDYETTPSFSLTVQATDNGTPSLSGSATITVNLINVNEPPVAVADSYLTIGNTELAAGGIAGLGVATVLSSTSVLANDSDPDSLASGFGNLAVVPAFGTTTKGGTFAIDALGRFRYTPPVGVLAPTVDPDTFPYTLTDGTNMVGGTVSVVVDKRVWYVKNDASAGGNGTSTAPFDSLASVNGAGGAGDPDGPGDILFVFTGDGTTTNQDGGIELEASQKLLGEGVDLVVDPDDGGLLAPITLVTGNPANKPKITNLAAGGDGVTVADITGVEIRGLDIAGTGNAIDVTSSGAGSAGVTITDNAISGAGTQGIRLAIGGSGTSVATVSNNTLTATGSAFDARTTAGELDLAFDANTDIDSGATGLVVDGSGGGKAVVTSLSGNGVAAGASGGMSFTNVVFDADPATAAFDTVAGGSAAVGSSGTPVGSGGVALTNVSGDLSFTQLDVYNSGAGPAGIQVTGSGLFTGAAGFRLQAAAGTVSTTGGPALAATTATIATSFTALSSSSSATNGISLTNTGGTLGSSGGSVSGSSGPAVSVSGGSTVLNLAGMTVAPAAGSMPALSGANSTGAFNLTGSTITKSGGRLIDFNNMDGGGSFATTTVSTTNHWGVSATNSNGTFGFPDVVIAAATPAAVDGAVRLQSNNAGFVGSFGKVDVAVSGSNRRGIVAINAGVVNITDGTSRATAIGGAALDLRTSTIGGNAGGWVLQSVGSTNSTQQGVNVNTVAGNLTINGGSISGAAANAFDLNAGASNVTYQGTISNSAAHSVEVTNHTGGTVSFTGAIGDTGTGISLATNGGSTISFSGGLTLATTTTNAFSATGGGTVTVTGASNTVSTSTGVGVDIQGTAIGGAGVAFRSVSSNGAPSGIVLNTTGGGPFTVAGDGPSDPGNTTRGRTTARQGGGTIVLGSGGTVNASTGPGVSLTSASNVTLRNLVITNGTGGDGVNASGVSNLTLDNLLVTGQASHHGIHGTSAAGLTIQHSEVANNATAAGTEASDIWNVRFDDLSGSARVENSTLHDSRENIAGIINTTGALVLNVLNSEFRDTTPSSPGNVGLELDLTGSAQIDATVAGSSFLRNRARGLQYLSNSGTTHGSLTVSGSVFEDNYVGVDVAHQSSGQTVSFDLNGNTFNQNGTLGESNPINVVLGGSSAATTVLSGRIRNNTIGNAAIANSGSSIGVGILTHAQGAGTLTALVQGNTIRQIQQDSAYAALADVGAAKLNLTFSGNDFSVNTADPLALNGLDLTAGAVAGDTATICANFPDPDGAGPLFANTAFIGQTFAFGVQAQIGGGSAMIDLQGYGGAANDTTAIGTFLSGTASSVTPAPFVFPNAGTIRAAPTPCATP